MTRFKRKTTMKISFEALFEEYQQAVFNYIYRLVGHRENAEDIFQEVFVKIYRKLPENEANKNLRAWIFTIVQNSIRDFFRRKKVRDNYFAEAEEPFNLETASDSSQILPDQYLISQEMQVRFEQIIVDLPLPQKEVFLLRHEAGLSFKQIAAILDCPVNRLLGRMHLAVKKFGRRWKNI
jgi:RNA polymerase sigma-70 factor (ECF subfamily)